MFRFSDFLTGEQGEIGKEPIGIEDQERGVECEERGGDGGFPRPRSTGHDHQWAIAGYPPHHAIPIPLLHRHRHRRHDLIEQLIDRPATQARFRAEDDPVGERGRDQFFDVIRQDVVAPAQGCERL